MSILHTKKEVIDKGKQAVTINGKEFVLPEDTVVFRLCNSSKYTGKNKYAVKVSTHNWASDFYLEGGETVDKALRRMVEVLLRNGETHLITNNKVVKEKD